MRMMTRTALILFMLSVVPCVPPVAARDVVVPAGKDVGEFFAELPHDVTRVLFTEAAEYRSHGDIVLPPRKLLVIDGAGARLSLGAGSNGFTVAVEDQKEAMRRTGNRYTIRDFAVITGGRKAIDLKASLGSVVENLRLEKQTEAAIDLRFCLMCRVEGVLVTHPQDKGILVRTGDWPGAKNSNSQSNHTVVRHTRVYCAPTTSAAFTVLHCNGVRISDCISEGGPADYDLYLSAGPVLGEDSVARAGNPVVKQFVLENFHVEHKLRKASIFVNMPLQASVTLSGVYWNGGIGAPVIEYVNGQLNLVDIGWFNKQFEILSRNNQPAITVQRCHSELRIPRTSTDGRAGVLRVADTITGKEGLKMNNVRVDRWKEE